MMTEFEYTIRVQLPEGASEKLKSRLLTFASSVEFAARIFAIKNHEYGDAIRFTGLRGATYEIIGGAARLNHLVNKVDPCDFPPPDGWGEMVGDTLLDILNYAVIGGMMLGEHNINGEM